MQTMLVQKANHTPVSSVRGLGSGLVPLELSTRERLDWVCTPQCVVLLKTSVMPSRILINASMIMEPFDEHFGVQKEEKTCQGDVVW